MTEDSQEVTVTKVEKESVSVMVEAAEATAARMATAENCIVNEGLVVGRSVDDREKKRR